MKNLYRLLFVLLLTLLCVSNVMAASPTCLAPAKLLSWPAVNPVWELCYLGAANSVGPEGSGMELRDVHLHGKLVMKKAHAPLLLAEYTTSTCYRDWMDTQISFVAQPAVRNQLGVSTLFNATTSCDRSLDPVASYGQCPFQLPGRNSGDCFSGVAIEDRGDHVVMTHQYSASWYFYTSRFYFYADGSFSPEFGFGNRDGTNNHITHWHHNYWRLDFDIEGPNNDVITEAGVVQPTEFASQRCNASTPTVCANERQWTIQDTITGRGFRLLPSAADYITPPNQSGRGFHMRDVIGTTYGATEYGDQATYDIRDCAVEHANLANGGDLDGASGEGTDVVLYYRVGVRDRTNEGAGTQDSMVCKQAGPVFTPIGNWLPVLFDNGFE